MAKLLDLGGMGTATTGTGNATVTITNASPAVISWTAHGFSAGQPVAFSTTGALPAGLVVGTIYYVIAAGLVTNAFEVSLTPGGPAINTTSAGSGTHTGQAALLLGAVLNFSYLTFAQAGAINGDVITYGIIDGTTNSEVGAGTYIASGPWLMRNVTKSTNSNAPISLSGSAQVFSTARTEDFIGGDGHVITPEAYGAKGDGMSAVNGSMTSGSPNFTTPQGNTSSTVTITNASPAVISWTAHGFSAGQQIVFSTTGVLPAGLIANIPYYVIAAGLVTNAFEVSATPGGSAVNTTTAGSGTHTGQAIPGYSFVSTDAGKYIMVAGAGAAGIPLVTTISSVSAGAAVLAVNASTTVTGSAYGEWGTDDSVALHNMAAASAGKAVWFGAGKLYFHTDSSGGPNQIRFGGTNFVIHGNCATVRAMANAPAVNVGFMFCDSTNVGIGPSDFEVRNLIYDANRTYRISSGAISNAVGGENGFYVIGAWHFQFIGTRALRTTGDGHYFGGDTRTGQLSSYFSVVNCFSGDSGRNGFTCDGVNYGNFFGCMAENITFGATKANVSYGWDLEPDGSWNQNTAVRIYGCVMANCTTAGIGSNITNGPNVLCSADQCTALSCGVGFYESGSGTFKVYAPYNSGNTTNFNNITPIGGNSPSITNTLSGDVALSSASYFDGPSVPLVGPNGVWNVSGSVTLLDTAGLTTFSVKLWDGTTIIASTVVAVATANTPVQAFLTGTITNPAGNLKISVFDVSRTTGVIKFNLSGNSKDSTITATKVG